MVQESTTPDLVDSDRHVEQRRGWVLLWVNGKLVRVAAYPGIDEARADAVAEERG